MTEDENRKRILKAVKERVKESDERERIRMVTNAIGDRRDRDLLDMIAQIEQDYGWSTALEYLLKAHDSKYTSPMTLGKSETNLEELKYREVVFSLLSCTGLEPVTIDTTTLLKDLYSEDSLIDASNMFLDNLESQAVEQIINGDTLFFDFTENTSVSQDTVDLLHATRRKNIQRIPIERRNNVVNISALWFCEYGRLALTELGIKGNLVDNDILNQVLSVIQKPISLGMDKMVFSKNVNDTFTHPFNKKYQKLLSHIIHQDIDGLSFLASRHSLPTLNILLDDASSEYKNTPSTSNFKKILRCINAHIAIRALGSVIALEKTTKLKDSRIITTAILAIGNFYHESAASTLVDILCKSRNHEVIETSTRSIENLYKKCLEADYVINSRLDRECTNHGRLVKLQRLLRQGKPMYY